MRSATALAAVVALLFGAVSAHAEERVDLVRAVDLGGGRGPAGAVAAAPRASYQEARTASRVFFTLPPRLSVQLGPRFIDGAPRPEVLVALYQDIPLRGLGRAREGAADAFVAYTDGAVVRARLDGALRAGLAWVAVREAEEVVALRHEATESARTISRIVGARTHTGTTTPAEEAVANAEAALAFAAELDAEGAVVEARSELRLAIGATDSVVAEGDLSVSDETPADEATSIALAMSSHPTLVALRRRTLAYEADAILQRAYQAPALTVGVSWAREGTGEQVLLGVLSLPIPVSRSGDYEASRTGAFAATERETEATERARVEEDVRLALHERGHSREVRRTYLTAVTALREAERLARVELDVGTEGLTGLLFARARRVGADERLVRAYGDVLRADLRFGHAIGRIPWRPR
ncbi:hypothetical protein BH09MYX1_BH09MYX1_29920 [soil metagenome]